MAQQRVSPEAKSFVDRLDIPDMGVTIAPPSLSPIDLATLRDRCGREIDQMDALLQSFVDESAVRLADLEHQFEAHNARAAQRTAASIRGSAQHVSARRLGEFASHIESLARTGDLLGAETFLPMLRDELDRCTAAVACIMTGGEQPV